MFDYLEAVEAGADKDAKEEVRCVCACVRASDCERTVCGRMVVSV